MTGGISDDHARRRCHRVFQDGMRDRRIVLEFISKRIAPNRKAQIAFLTDQKDETTLGARDAQRRLYQRYENIIERAAAVELARYFEEEGQLLQI